MQFIKNGVCSMCNIKNVCGWMRQRSNTNLYFIIALHVYHTTDRSFSHHFNLCVHGREALSSLSLLMVFESRTIREEKWERVRKISRQYTSCVNRIWCCLYVYKIARPALMRVVWLRKVCKKTRLYKNLYLFTIKNVMLVYKKYYCSKVVLLVG